MRMLTGTCSSNLKKAVEPEDTKQHVFVCMFFQLLVIVNNVQTIAEPLFKQHEKTSRLIILWFQKYLLNETMQ